jgi:hypothetical protein
MAVAASGVTAPGWFQSLAARAAAAPRREHKSCILLWMAGGPSQLDTFDMKPDAPAAIRGEFQPIATNVSGIQICEHLPRLAKQADKLALLRNMSTGEADHHRASYYLQTGYKILPNTNHPLLGSIVSAERDREASELPNFFWLNGSPTANAGYLGARHAPMQIHQIHEQAERNLENSKPARDFAYFDQSLSLLDRWEDRFQNHYPGAKAIADHRAVYQSAARLMRSSKLSALDLASEPPTARAAYGEKNFGKSCLLARRLVEAGVPFVGIRMGDYDTHNDNWSRLKPLLAELDLGMSALLDDLDARGLLDSTLLIWMGEFGRSPQISGGNHPGRDHYAKAWTTVLAGAGLKTGQAIGSSGKDGLEVEDRPTTARDFMATVCKTLEIDYTKEYTTPESRPIAIAEAGSEPVAELFGA